MRLERELMRGAGPIAVMKLLSTGEMYGYELVQTLAQRTDQVLAMGQSTLYPMLYNLEAKGLVTSRIDKTTGRRPRKYYRLTAKGKKKLTGDTQQWVALSQALVQLGVGPASACKAALLPGPLTVGARA